MITIFAIPKAFKGHFATIQCNAIISWTLLQPKPEIILFGNDEGTAEICQKLGLRHIPKVARNEFGTPLVNDLFEQAQQLATYKLLCYVNSDILFLRGFTQAIGKVSQLRQALLMVGQRCDIEITELWSFSEIDWGKRLRDLAKDSGELKPPNWIDYFVFSKGLFKDIPPFAIGRPAYDNWLVWYASSQQATVVDATPRVLALHQNHDYSHAQGEESVWKGEEAQRNKLLTGDWTHHYTISHASHVLTDQGVRRAWASKYIAARLDMWKRKLISWTRPLRHFIGLRQETLIALRHFLKLAG